MQHLFRSTSLGLTFSQLQLNHEGVPASISRTVVGGSGWTEIWGRQEMELCVLALVV